MDLTVVIANYLRPANMQVILDALASQIAPHQLFVWDNSPDQSFEDTRADWVIQSSRNAKCVGRWWLAAHAETDWVVVMDDDLVPSDARVLTDILRALVAHAPSAVGATGVILDPAKSYFDCQHIGLDRRRIGMDTQVDIIKGRLFAAPTRRLQSLPFLPLDCEDDIAVSALLGGGVVASRLQGRFRELPSGDESRWRRPNHGRAREAARRAWYK